MKTFIADFIRGVRPAPLASAIANMSGLNRRVAAPTEDGIFYVNPLSDFGYRLARGEYEPQTRAVLARYLTPGAVFIDVGANEGYFTVLGSRLVGTHGTVIAVEPQSRLQEVIKTNLIENKCGNVQVVKAAISFGSQRMTLKLAPDMNTGATSLYRSTKYALPEEDVQCMALPELLDKVGLDRCDLMKVDVEGAEYDLFTGAQAQLRRGIIRSICVEVHDSILAQRGLSWETIHRLFFDCGYRWDGNRDPRVYNFFE